MSSFAEEYEYELHDDQPSGIARWIVPALIISLLLHVIFYMWASRHVVQPFSDSYYEKIVPRTFQLDRVDIDPALLEPVPEEETKAASAPEAVKLPDEKFSFEKMMADVKASPAAPPIENPLLAEKPKAPKTNMVEAVQAAEQSGEPVAVEDAQSLREELLVDDPQVAGRPLLELSAADKGGKARVPEGAAAGGDTPGFSDLDALLAQTGPLTDGTAPILMPADLLYDYDSAQLRIEAMESLRKLGRIIARNPQADFIIEGYTDSFGENAYNLELSRRRAESVKAWLVQAMGVNPARIETRGFGASHWLVQPSAYDVHSRAAFEAEKARQQLNRRVEIVIRSRKGR